ncbi:hypothetical protein Lalb_Chr15g0084711 [Lupinus albus]|uniref:Uncharacterized protein n=1 Tax=Lupinus albus TaxID=3870 RepID=A0A6A4PDK5_LUPAL|nr:hypothetical protein Lalb_Chr15g0084711 [Lupinus albus]
MQTRIELSTNVRPNPHTSAIKNLSRSCIVMKYMLVNKFLPHHIKITTLHQHT